MSQGTPSMTQNGNLIQPFLRGYLHSGPNHPLIFLPQDWTSSRDLLSRGNQSPKLLQLLLSLSAGQSIICPGLDHSDLGSPSSADVYGSSCSPPMLPLATDASNQPSLEVAPTQQGKVNGMQVVWDSLRGRRVLEKASTVILKSWRGSTQKQYQVCLQMWYCFCS